MECLSLVPMALAPARSPSNPFRERLECSEGGNTGRRARRPCRMLSTNNRGESLQPSVQLPAGGERKAGFIGLFEEKATLFQPPLRLVAGRCSRSASLTARLA